MQFAYIQSVHTFVVKTFPFLCFIPFTVPWLAGSGWRGIPPPTGRAAGPGGSLRCDACTREPDVGHWCTLEHKEIEASVNVEIFIGDTFLWASIPTKIKPPKICIHEELATVIRMGDSYPQKLIPSNIYMYLPREILWPRKFVFTVD